MQQFLDAKPGRGRVGLGSRLAVRLEALPWQDRIALECSCQMWETCFLTPLRQAETRLCSELTKLFLFV